MLATAVSELEPGTNRFGFGLFDRARSQLADAKVAVYVAPVGGGPASGPFPARYESLDTDAEFRSAGVEKDKDAAKSVYVADLRFKQARPLRGAGRRAPGRPLRGGHARGRAR